MAQLTRKHLLILLALAISAMLVPNSLLRTWLPRPGSLSTATAAPTADEFADEYERALSLASSNPLEALPLLQEIIFSGSVNAGNARVVARAIQAARLSGDHAYLLTQSGRALATIGEWAHARLAFLRAVEETPNYAEAWAYLGEAQQQKEEDGFPALKHALELNPQSLSANLFTALYWQRQGSFNEADKYLHIAALIAPEDPSILIQWGQNAVLQGDVIAARERFERAAELSPDDLQVWKTVAYYSIDSEVFVEELGLPAARILLQENASDAEALTLAARGYILLGHSEIAVTFFERAIKSQPEYPSVHLYYGLFLLASGDLEEARGHLDLVIALSPESSEAEIAARWIGLTYQ
ncbi:MAG: tetratricopeptide repeat protein [Anaerolineales bacterium]